MRSLLRWTTVAGLTLAGAHWAAGAVAAECPFIPPFPRAEPAIRSAKDVIVGDLVAASAADLGVGPNQERQMALRITDVLRGPKRVGAILDVQFLQPNWPWIGIRGEPGRAFPSCTYLGMKAGIGDRIVLALGAVMPRQRIEAGGMSWIQPRTTYNGMTKIRTEAQLAQIRWIAGLPQTDLLAHGSRSPDVHRYRLWPVVFAIGLAGGVAAWRRGGRVRER